MAAKRAMTNTEISPSNLTIEAIETESQRKRRILDSFRAKPTYEVDLGPSFGKIVLKIPQSYNEFQMLKEQALEKARGTYGPSCDPNYVYVFLLAKVLDGWNEFEVEELIFNCPDLSAILIRAIDEASGNVITTLQWLMVEQEKKDSQQSQGTDSSKK